MRWTEALQGVRVIKFRSVFEHYEASELGQIDAAPLRSRPIGVAVTVATLRWA